MMKHITCFITSLSSGGAERQLTILTDMLKNKGYVVDIVTFADVPDHYGVHKEVKRVRLAENKHPILKFLTIFWYFIRLKSDVVISFGQRENVFALIPLLFRPNIKMIAGERNLTVDSQTLYEKLLFSFLYKRANYVVPNSFSQRRYIIEKKPGFENKVVTITNYTDLEHYSFTQSPNSEVPRIGVFCRYAAQKNYAFFALMLKILKEKGYKLKVDWYGNKTYKNSAINSEYLNFSKLIIDYDISDMISLNDHVKDVRALMSHFDAVCVPSLREGWSNSISEGICCGKPMLVSDISDNSVMVLDGENGFLFSPTDINQMCDAFIKFINLTTPEKERMAKNSRNRAEVLFNSEKFIENYIDLIEK